MVVEPCYTAELKDDDFWPKCCSSVSLGAWYNNHASLWRKIMQGCKGDRICTTSAKKTFNPSTEHGNQGQQTLVYQSLFCDTNGLDNILECTCVIKTGTKHHPSYFHTCGVLIWCFCSKVDHYLQDFGSVLAEVAAPSLSPSPLKLLPFSSKIRSEGLMATLCASSMLYTEVSSATSNL